MLGPMTAWFERAAVSMTAWSVGLCEKFTLIFTVLVSQSNQLIISSITTQLTPNKHPIHTHHQQNK